MGGLFIHEEFTKDNQHENVIENVTENVIEILTKK